GFHNKRQDRIHSAVLSFLLLRKLQIVTLWITATHVASSASSSAQQLANFILLHCDKSTSARSSPGFLYLIAKGSSLYVAKRTLALLFRPAPAPSNWQTSPFSIAISQHRLVPRRVSFISLRRVPVCTLVSGRLRFCSVQKSILSGSLPVRSFRLSASSCCISSSESVKSNTSALERTRSGRTDFGMTMMSCWRCQRMTTCAGVLPCASEMRITTGSSISFPRASGDHAVT